MIEAINGRIKTPAEARLFESIYEKQNIVTDDEDSVVLIVEFLYASFITFRFACFIIYYK